MSFFDDIKKQPRHVREIMFGLCVVTTISLVGLIWFRSFEEDVFVLLNTDPAKQAQFYAQRAGRTPTVYAAATKAFGNMRATMYSAFGFLDNYNSNVVNVDEEYKGGAKQLPLSGDK